MRSAAAPVDCSISRMMAGWPGFITMATKIPRSWERGRSSEQQIKKGGLLNIKLIPACTLHCSGVGAGIERETHRCTNFWHTSGRFTQAAAPLSRSVTRPCIAPPPPPPQQVTTNRWRLRIYIPMRFIPQPPSPKVPASHLPLSISVPPGRLARDGSAPLVQNRSAAEGVWGRHDPLRD